MTYSVHAHNLGYSLTTAEAFSLLTTTAIPYALRHRELAQTQENNWLGHQVLFIAECIPVIGILVAAIEYLAASYFLPPSLLSHPAEPLSNRASITPIVPLPSSPSLPPAGSVNPRTSFPLSATAEPVRDTNNAKPVIDPLLPISHSSEPAAITPGATEPEESISSLPTNFNTKDDLLREAQDYFNNAKIPDPLTFPEINLQGLSQNNLIETFLEKYEGLCIGEYHTNSSPKYFLTVNMPLFKRLGVNTLYLEGYDDLQAELDAYFAGATVDLPLSIRERINRFYATGRGYTEIDVLMAAKREGIRMVNIDSRAARGAPREGILRTAAMNYQAKLIIDEDRAKYPGGKSIIYAGSAHTNRIAGLPGLGQIYHFPSILIRDRSGSCFIGADAISLPDYSIKKEVVEKINSDRRTENSDFIIEIDTPLKWLTFQDYTVTT